MGKSKITIPKRRGNDKPINQLPLSHKRKPPIQSSRLTGQDKVPNVGSSDGQGIHGDGGFVLGGHLDRFQVGVHLRVDGCLVGRRPEGRGVEWRRGSRCDGGRVGCGLMGIEVRWVVVSLKVGGIAAIQEESVRHKMSCGFTHKGRSRG